MAIENRKGEKVSAQVYAKELLKEALDSFKLEETDRFSELKRTEPVKVQAFLDKLKLRIDKILVEKEKEVK
jgi:hypothetical protein